MDSLGKRVRTLRENMNLTQQDLGDIVGLHGTNIGRIESGKVFPASDILLKMSLYFNVSCDWLLTGENAFSQIFADADIPKLVESSNQLSQKDKNEIQEMIDFKIYRANKEKVDAKSLNLNYTGKDNMVG